MTLLKHTPTTKNILSKSAVMFRQYVTEATTQTQTKPEGDISSVFVSLSGGDAEPLPPRFADLKRSLVSKDLQASWTRLLHSLRDEVAVVKQRGSDVIPQIKFSDLIKGSNQNGEDSSSMKSFVFELKKRGVAVVRGVVPEEEAVKYKKDVKEYIKQNPGTKAFPPNNPQVYELYWSPSQLRARAHPNLLATQKILMSHSWHNRNSPDAPVSIKHPTVYANRLRIRQPGDATFSLGPHVDGGSVERWEPNGYGLGNVYDSIFAGSWESYDPWDAVARLPVHSDLYNGAGACTMFRMFQGWLSMSVTGPGEGTLRVNPLLRQATAYYLLRPFFSPRKQLGMGVDRKTFLSPENWVLEEEITSQMQGASPGRCQELNDELHPHLELASTMVDVPQIRPGDYVVWHCDTIHAVDPVHNGSTDSSVLYIPVCPLTETNAGYLARQREAFFNGTPGPDFPGGKGESEHIGRPGKELIEAMGNAESLRGFGLKPWDEGNENETKGEREMLRTANQVLGF